MRKLIPLFLIILGGCGKSIDDFLKIKNRTVKKSKSDPTFFRFVNSFNKQFNTDVKIPIIFKKLSMQYAGICIVYGNGYREIQINKIHWNIFPEDQKEQLIYHELGHCVFNREHENSMLDFQCPKSIMRSFMFSDYEISKCYLLQYNHYMEELENGV